VCVCVCVCVCVGVGGCCINRRMDVHTYTCVGVGVGGCGWVYVCDMI